MIPISKYKELGIKPIWNYMKDVSEFTEYFSTIKDWELPDRVFLRIVSGTLKREVCQYLLDQARNSRGKAI